jgi:hypothetical protein
VPTTIAVAWVSPIVRVSVLVMTLG